MATPTTRTLDNRSGLDAEATRRAAELAERLHRLVTEHGTPRRMSWGKGFQTVLQCTEGRLTVRLFHNNRFLAAYWHAEGEGASPENQVFLAKAGLPRGGTTYTVKCKASYEQVCARLLPIGRAKAHRLHRAIGRAQVGCHKRFASETLQREVEHLRLLTHTEHDAVEQAAFGRLARRESNRRTTHASPPRVLA